MFLRRKTCALMRAKISSLLRRATCVVLIGSTCALFRANTMAVGFGRHHWGRAVSAASPRCDFLCEWSKQNTCPSLQHSTWLAPRQGRCLRLQQGAFLASRQYDMPNVQSQHKKWAGVGRLHKGDGRLSAARFLCGFLCVGFAHLTHLIVAKPDMRLVEKQTICLVETQDILLC